MNGLPAMEIIARPGGYGSTRPYALYNSPAILTSALGADYFDRGRDAEVRRERIMSPEAERMKIMSTLNEIEKLTKDYADWRVQLSEAVLVAEHEIAALKRQHVVAIKRKVEAVAERQAALKAAIEESPELFRKPRTMTIHGVKIGFQKEKGTISWDDKDQVIRLIKKHFPEQADVLIKTTEKPIKDALQQLSAAELQRIGVTIGETGDVVVIKSTDSEIDKLVNALLKGDEEAEAETEAA